MAEENLVLEQLRLMRNEMRGIRNDLGERMDRIEIRLNSVEHQVAGLRSDLAFVIGDRDTLAKRVERIERRLDLRDDV